MIRLGWSGEQRKYIKSIESWFGAPYSGVMPANLLAALHAVSSAPPAPLARLAVGAPLGPDGDPFPRTAVRLVVAVVGMRPQADQLPGGALLQNLMNGLQFWALALALVGLVIGAAAWALGSHGQNYQQSFVGRRAVLISGLAALLIGAGPGIVNFFYTAGTGVHGG